MQQNFKNGHRKSVYNTTLYKYELIESVDLSEQ